MYAFGERKNIEVLALDEVKGIVLFHSESVLVDLGLNKMAVISITVLGCEMFVMIIIIQFVITFTSIIISSTISTIVLFVDFLMTMSLF